MGGYFGPICMSALLVSYDKTSKPQIVHIFQEFLNMFSCKTFLSVIPKTNFWALSEFPKAFSKIIIKDQMNSACFLIRLIMICSNLCAKINFIVCIIILEAIYRRITTANFIVLVLTSCYELNECKVCADDIITVNSIQNFFIPKVLTNFSQTPVLN